jgi:hypothetical protein
MTPAVRTICVDFDGTICEYAFPKCGPPHWQVIAALRSLNKSGWRIIIHSSRVNRDWSAEERRRRTGDMVEYLYVHSVPFDQVWGAELSSHLPGRCPGGLCPDGRIVELNGDAELKVCVRVHFPDRDVGKPIAHVYLDDRALPVVPRVGSQVWPAYTEHEIISACREIADWADREHSPGTA